MELGQRLKQARLDAGLSQRQLCGDTITRNMLSQIENGSAKPSMDTLRQLASRLGKPMGYFLEDQAITSPNQALMDQARRASPEEALVLLKTYQAPDPVFDRERWLLEVLACLNLAQRVCAAKPGYAAALLEQAAAAGANTPYYTPELERRRLLLCYEAKALPPVALAAALPSDDRELLLRAQAALDRGDPTHAAVLLDAAAQKDARWHYLRAEAAFAQQQYDRAREHYRQAGESRAVFARLEACCRELEDYKMAYFYACKQR